ncbi:MAG TPA: hypothetical protein VFG04_20210 [Planctomycetaceae bacterium]|jgi:hypothetical protein|nr:hypothetical protein [Planctomycetaceae bacterium]
MDCRQALQILEFDDLAAGGLPAEVGSVEDRAAAEAHLESCPTCARTVGNRRELDRTIGQVMRAVPIPRGSQQRLLARLAELETADTAVAMAADDENSPRNGQASSLTTTPAVEPAQSNAAFKSRRRFLKVVVPLAACLMAAVGFFGAVWVLIPRWSVEDISQALTEVDFESLETLGNFTGSAEAKAAQLPFDPVSDRLKWACDKQAKGLIDSNVIAVYGFDLPKTRRSAAVRGLIAVLPRSRIRGVPAADSLATASPTGYVAARIGDSICVAWQQGDLVCVCLLKGGPDSLETLQSALAEPAT